MPQDEYLNYHVQSWLRYQDRIVSEDSETLKRDLLEQQDLHANRYCAMQGNDDLLNELKLKILPGEQLGI